MSRFNSASTARGIAIALLTAWIQATSANPIMVDLGFDNFGHLGNDGSRCQATALVNSWQFLVNRYPGVYGGTQLLQGTLANTRDRLANGWTNNAGVFRPGVLGCGALGDESWWEHKNLWLMDFAPGTTVVKGMVDPRGQPHPGPQGWNFREFLVDAVPTVEFLLQELRHGEDVEVTVRSDAGTAHSITLYKILIDDMDNNGQWDLTEPLSFMYIDPNNPNVPLSTGNVQPKLNDGRLEFLWNNGNNPAETVHIDAAFSESPRSIPEPSTLLLLMLGAGAAAACRARPGAQRVAR